MRGIFAVVHTQGDAALTTAATNTAASEAGQVTCDVPGSGGDGLSLVLAVWALHLDSLASVHSHDILFVMSCFGIHSKFNYLFELLR